MDHPLGSSCLFISYRMPISQVDLKERRIRPSVLAMFSRLNYRGRYTRFSNYQRKARKWPLNWFYPTTSPTIDFQSRINADSVTTLSRAFSNDVVLVSRRFVLILDLFIATVTEDEDTFSAWHNVIPMSLASLTRVTRSLLYAKTHVIRFSDTTFKISTN